MGIEKTKNLNMSNIDFSRTSRVPTFLFSHQDGGFDKERMQKYIKYHQFEEADSPNRQRKNQSVSHASSKQRFLSPCTSRGKIEKIGKLIASYKLI
jgi:hypothetical protein